MLRLEFSVGQIFCAYEYSFARDSHRRCFDFALSSALYCRCSERKSSADSPRLLPRQSAKNCFHVVSQTDRGGSPCVRGIFVGFARGSRLRPLVALLSHCFIERITGDPPRWRNAGRTRRRHQLRVFCATPSRKRHLEPVIGAVLHCMWELAG